jgi:hypothetical protein
VKLGVDLPADYRGQPVKRVINGYHTAAAT